MKLKELLKEYADARWYKQPLEQRFVFDTEAERHLFVMRLNELNADYYLYQDKLFKVDVFYERN